MSEQRIVEVIAEWFDQEKGYLCARCANWTTYCDYCKARSRLRAKARQRALKQLQRRYPDEFADRCGKSPKENE